MTRFLILLVTALACAAPALAQAPGFLAPPGLPAAAFPKPERPVAEIVSPVWSAEGERDRIDEAGQVARLMGLGPGRAVADIGAGGGYYVVRLAPLVGPEGRIFAQDVTPKYLAELARRVDREGLKNVTLALGEGHDPRLPRASVDAAILIHMYHEIEQPFAFMHNLKSALKPGGRVGIVDLDRETWRHGTPRALLRCELAAVGYREVSFQTLKGDPAYLAVFEPERDVKPGEVKACPVKAP
jgi:predicted methyltransferase